MFSFESLVSLFSVEPWGTLFVALGEPVKQRKDVRACKVNQQTAIFRRTADLFHPYHCIVLHVNCLCIFISISRMWVCLYFMYTYNATWRFNRKAEISKRCSQFCKKVSQMNTRRNSKPVNTKCVSYTVEWIWSLRVNILDQGYI